MPDFNRLLDPYWVGRAALGDYTCFDEITDGERFTIVQIAEHSGHTNDKYLWTCIYGNMKEWRRLKELHA